MFASGPSWQERLNMQFFSKVFTQDSPLVTKMAQYCELEAQLQEVLSLLIPEAERSGNPLIKNYANQVADITDQMKVSPARPSPAIV